MTIFITILALAFGAAVGYIIAHRSQQKQLAEFSELKSRFDVVTSQLDSANSQLQASQAELQSLRDKLTTAESEKARLSEKIESERNIAVEKLRLLDDAQKQLSDAFKALSAESLKNNTQEFLRLADDKFQSLQKSSREELDHRRSAIEEMVKPLGESLLRYDKEIHEIEKNRLTSFEILQNQVQTLKQTNDQLNAETRNLVKALRQPATRGRWGEMQLKNVVEMAGMVEHCDFIQQQSINTEQGRLRPDMVIRMPGKKTVVVDAKTPMENYLNSIETEIEEERIAYLKNHARNVSDRIKELSKKTYWDSVGTSPEFVVLFLPGEPFFSAALQQDPGLIEFGVSQRVIIATPTTLVALLQVVAFGWQQEKITQNAEEISRLGKELYERLAVFSSHLVDMGKGINRTVDCYNKAVGSFESRALVSARKFPELGTSVKNEIQGLDTIDKIPKKLQT